MKYLKIIYLLFLIASVRTLNGQSFEGSLTYKVTFEIKNSSFNDQMKEAIIDKMKNDGEYYDSLNILIKGGDYIKEDNSKEGRRIIYKQEDNKLYIFTKDSDYVTIVSGEKHTSIDIDLPKPKIKKSNTSEVVLGERLKSLTLSWKGLGEEVYSYSPELLKIDPNLFKQHNYEYLNMVLSNTGAYPMQMVKSVNNLISIKLTLVDFQEKPVMAELFQLPNLEETNSEYAQSIYQATGNKVMKIVN